MEGHRILVVANETLAGQELLNEIGARAGGSGGEVLVVAPALNSRLHHLFADVDQAREQAEVRLRESIDGLARGGITARGAVGDSDPVRAIEDALAEFDADQIIISTHPPDRSNWLEKRVVERAQQRFDLPITHVVVDLVRDRAGTR